MYLDEDEDDVYEEQYFIDGSIVDKPRKLTRLIVPKGPPGKSEECICWWQPYTKKGGGTGFGVVKFDPDCPEHGRQSNIS